MPEDIEGIFACCQPVLPPLLRLNVHEVLRILVIIFLFFSLYFSHRIFFPQIEAKKQGIDHTAKQAQEREREREREKRESQNKEKKHIFFGDEDISMDEKETQKMEYSKGTHLSDFLKEEIAVMKRALETIKGTIVTKLDPKNGEGISSKGSDSLFCFLNEEQKVWILFSFNLIIYLKIKLKNTKKKRTIQFKNKNNFIS